MITFLATDCELTPARRQLPGLGPTKAGLVRALRNSGLFSRHPRRDEVRTFIQNAASPTRSGVACYRSASLGGPHHIGAMCRLPPRIERGATLGRGPRWGAAVLTTTGLGTGHKINPRARYVAGVESAKSVPGFKTCQRIAAGRKPKGRLRTHANQRRDPAPSYGQYGQFRQFSRQAFDHLR